MKPTRSNIVTLAMIAALILLAVLGQQLSPLLLPKADVAATVEQGCDLQKQPCIATFGDGGRLQLSISPRPITFLSPLRVEVNVSGAVPAKVELDFAGASMNMGYNRSQLTATGTGSHGGESSLPVCVSGSMDWVATVMIETDRRRISAPFRFKVGH